ncbi:MAG: WbqC family protein [Bacteroidales bacterium]|nr:WbqC family protein [Bacteroidales bacterium]
MNCVIFSSYFPSISYISKFIICDSVTIDIYEKYIKQTYRNRCNIMAANGINSLIVPVKKNHNGITKETVIDYSENWQKSHYRTLLSAYKNSAFYDYYIPELMPLFNEKEKFLINLNSKILEIIFKILNLSPIYCYSNKYIENEDSKDYRNLIHPKSHKNIEDKEFSQAEYVQVFSDRHGFVKDLSILDLIFNMGPLSLGILQKSISRTNTNLH